MTEVNSVQTLLSDTFDDLIDVTSISNAIIDQLKEVSCKTTIRLVERAIFDAEKQDLQSPDEIKGAQLSALNNILQDFAGDEAVASRVCHIP
jgi:hypothetical protein